MCTQRALFESLTWLLDELPCGAALVDQDGVVASSNGRFGGFAECVLVDVPWRDLVLRLEPPPRIRLLEAQVEAGRLLLEAVGEAVRDGLAVLAADCREVLFANRRFWMLTGWSPGGFEVWLQRAVQEGRVDLSEGECVVQMAGAGGATTGLGPGGAGSAPSMRLRQLTDEEGGVVAFVGVVRGYP